MLSIVCVPLCSLIDASIKRHHIIALPLSIVSFGLVVVINWLFMQLCGMVWRCRSSLWASLLTDSWSGHSALCRGDSSPVAFVGGIIIIGVDSYVRLNQARNRQDEAFPLSLYCMFLQYVDPDQRA